MGETYQSSNTKFYVATGAVVVVALATFLFMPRDIKVSKSCPDGRYVEVSSSEGFLLQYVNNSLEISVKSRVGDSGDLKLKKQVNHPIDNNVKNRDALLRARMLEQLEEAC